MFDAKIIILRCKTKSIFCAPNDPILTTPISAQNVSFGPKCHIFVGKWGGQNRVIWRENNRFCFTSWNDYFCIKHVKRTLINIVWGRKHVIASLKKIKFQCQNLIIFRKITNWATFWTHARPPNLTFSTKCEFLTLKFDFFQRCNDMFSAPNYVN